MQTGHPIKAVLRSPLVAVIAALLLRLALLHATALRPGHPFQTIGQETGNLVLSMILGRGFSAPVAGMRGPTAWIAPIYPMLLAEGVELLRVNHVLIGQALNCIFAALTCWPIYLTGKKLFGKDTGLASAWIWAVLPTAILFPLEWIWDQSLSALLLASLVCATIYLKDSRRAAAWASYGLGWALAALTNPAIGILLPFLLAWLAWQRKRNSEPWRWQAAIALLVCVAGVAPWTVRNYAAFGRFIPVKSNFGLELWLGNNPEVRNVWSWWLSPASSVAENAEIRRVGEIAYMQQKQHEAESYILARPETFARNCLERIVDNWTALWDYRTDPWLATLHAGRAYVLFSVVFSMLAFGGLALALHADGGEVFPLLAAMLLFPVIYYVTHTAARYRHPIDPVMTLLATYAAGWAYAKARSVVTVEPTQMAGARPARQDEPAPAATRSSKPAQAH